MKTNSITYRWIYIIFATFVSTLIVYNYAMELPELISNDHASLEVLMCTGQLLWQGCIILVFIQQKVHVYLFHMITISFIGAIALIPMIIWYRLEQVSLEIRIFLFLSVVCLMILEHLKRVKKLKLPMYLTTTWIAYRVLWIPLLIH